MKISLGAQRPLPITSMDNNYFVHWKYVEREAKTQANFMRSQENVRVGSMIVCLWSYVAVTGDDSAV